MKRAVFLLSVLPAFLAAAGPGKASPEKVLLDKTLGHAGGFIRYERMETFTCRFKEVLVSSPSAARQGRWALRVHDGEGLRLREDVDGGTVTVVNSSAPVSADLLRDVSWLFLPQRLKEEGNPLRRLSTGFFLGRLLDRLAVDGAPLFPGGEGLILFLDRSDAKIVGVSFGAGPTYVSFHSPAATSSQLVVPTRLVTYDASERKVRTVEISGIVVNGYLEESLFEGATP